MIEVLPDMPEGVTGIRVSGRLRGHDLREFKPAMEKLLKTAEIRIVEVVAPDYEGFGPGGLIEDLKLGLGALIQHHSAFKRIAVVTDKNWAAHALHACGQPFGHRPWIIEPLRLFAADRLAGASQGALPTQPARRVADSDDSVSGRHRPHPYRRSVRTKTGIHPAAVAVLRRTGRIHPRLPAPRRGDEEGLLQRANASVRPATPHPWPQTSHPAARRALQPVRPLSSSGPCNRIAQITWG